MRASRRHASLLARIWAKLAANRSACQTQTGQSKPGSIGAQRPTVEIEQSSRCPYGREGRWAEKDFPTAIQQFWKGESQQVCNGLGRFLEERVQKGLQCIDDTILMDTRVDDGGASTTCAPLM